MSRRGLVALVAVLAIAWVGFAKLGGGGDTSTETLPGAPATASSPAPDIATPPTSADDLATNSATLTTPDASVDESAADPPIQDDLIPYPAARRQQAAAYSQRHYGTRTADLDPQTIVLHFTETDSYQPVWNTFAANTPAPGPAGSRPEPPGTCSHFIIEQDGTTHRLVPLTLQCRHTIGLNRWAIGIEIVQATHGHTSHWADQQILDRPAQITAALGLVRSLQRDYEIPTDQVIGHATANTSPLFLDLAGWRNDHTDWQAEDVAEFRTRLEDQTP